MNHCPDSLSLDSLAKDLYLSKYYLIRKCKRNLGLTPYKFHLQNRIRKAHTLLFTNSDPGGNWWRLQLPSGADRAKLQHWGTYSRNAVRNPRGYRRKWYLHQWRHGNHLWTRSNLCFPCRHPTWSKRRRRWLVLLCQVHACPVLILDIFITEMAFLDHFCLELSL